VRDDAAECPCTTQVKEYPSCLPDDRFKVSPISSAGRSLFARVIETDTSMSRATLTSPRKIMDGLSIIRPSKISNIGIAIGLHAFKDNLNDM